MFWDISHYNNVEKALNDKRYKSAFSYLFNFNQYVSWDTPLMLDIEIEREGAKMNFDVRPLKKSSTHILAY